MDNSTQNILIALRHGELSWEEVKSILTTKNKALLHTVLEHLQSELITASPVKWSEISASLPFEVSDLEPETSKLLAECYRIADPKSPLPQWRSSTVNALVFNAWTETELIRSPSAVLTSIQGMQSHLAIKAIDIADYPLVEPLITNLLQTGDTQLMLIGCQKIEEAIQSSVIAPETAANFLHQLIQKEPIAIVALSALRLYAQPWVAGMTLPREEIERYLEHSQPELRFASLNVLRHCHDFSELALCTLTNTHHSRDLLLQVINIASESAPAQYRGAILSLLAEDPLYFGAAVIDYFSRLSSTWLLQPEFPNLQKRGNYRVSDDLIESFFVFYQKYPIVPPLKIFQAIGSRIDKWIELLKELSAADSSWSNQIAILELSNCELASNYLLHVLHIEEYKSIWPEIILSLGRLNYLSAEQRVTELLMQEWPSVEVALRFIGGEHTIKMLLHLLDNDNSNALLKSNSHFITKNSILKLLLDITDDHTELFDTLCIDELDSTIISRLGNVSSASLEAVLCRKLKRNIELHTIQALARSGGTAAIEALENLLLNEDPDIVSWAQSALREIGSIRYSQNSARPHSLLNATDANIASSHFLSESLITLIDKNVSSTQHMIHLLRQLMEIDSPHPDLKRTIKSCLRSDSVEILKLALEIVDKHALDLVFEVLPFLKHEDIRLKRPAIRAIASLSFQPAANNVAKGLYHGNMNIKKEAAAALGIIGGRDNVRDILHWLSVHDNPGFREALYETLKAISGRYSLALTCDALNRKNDTREQYNLLLLLNRKMSINAVVTTIRNGAQWSNHLLKLISEDVITLSQGTKIELITALTRQGLKTDMFDVIDENIKGSPIDALRQWKSGLSPTDFVESIQDIYRNLNPSRVDYLRKNLDDILVRTLQEPNREIRTELLTILNKLVLSCTTGEKISVYSTFRSIVKQGDNNSLQCLEYLQNNHALVITGTPQQPINTWSIEQTLADDIHLSIADIFDQDNSTVRRHLLHHALHRQQHAEIIHYLLHNKPQFINELWRHWIAPNDLDTLSILLEQQGTFGRHSRQTNIDLSKWIISFQDERVSPLLVSLLKSDNESFANIALEQLKVRPPTDTAAQLLALYPTVSQKVRIRIAGVFSQWPGVEYHDLLIKSALNGELGDAFPATLRCNVHNLDVYFDKEMGASAQKTWVNLVSNSLGPSNTKAQLLLDHWKDTYSADVELQIRDSLRGYSSEILLPLLWEDLDNEHWSALDLLHCTPVINDQLLPFFGKSELGDQVLLEFFDRSWTSISSKALINYLVDLYDSSNKKIVTSIIAKLSDWEHVDTSDSLLLTLLPIFKKHNSLSLLTATLSGLEHLDVQQQFNLLEKLFDNIKEPVILDKMARLMVQNPALIDSITRTTTERVERLVFEFTGDRDEMLARKTLLYISNSSDTDRMSYFEQGLHHPSSRVRIYAHRLIRKHGDKEEYLEASRILLHDKNIGLRRLALRALSFAQYVPAVREIALLLFDKKMVTASHSALLVYGDAALPILENVSKSIRPDRRRG